MADCASSLTPYALGWPPLAGGLGSGPGFEGVCRLDPLDPDGARFGRLLQAANALAFGALGMPAWVQLDCATLPSAFHGFALPRSAVPTELLERLLAQPGLAARRGELADDAGLVPVSGFCALRTPRPDTIVAISLFSILPGHGLGVRTKALGLLAHGAATQVGVTQYDNPALRVHAAFGPLEIVSAVAHGHTHPARSFVYRLAVPPAAVLRARLAEGRGALPAAPSDAFPEPVDSGLGGRIAARLTGGPPLHIVPPGLVRDGGQTKLWLRAGARDAIRARVP